MLTSTLRNVGGSVMMAIPKSVLEGLGLAANEKVLLRLEGRRLVIEPQRRHRYTLEELVSRCDASAPMSDDLRGFDEAAPKGAEIF